MTRRKGPRPFKNDRTDIIQYIKLLGILSLVFVLEWQLNIATKNLHQIFGGVVKAQVHQEVLVSPITIENIKLPTPTPVPTPSESPDPVAQNKWDEFVIASKKVCKIYNFPCQVVIAQGALESAHGRSNFCQHRNNCLGIGAYDDNPNNAFVYENMEQSVIQYMMLIKKTFPEAWANRSNPDMVIFRLKYNSNGSFYASDPNYVAKVKAMPEWGEK